MWKGFKRVAVNGIADGVRHDESRVDVASIMLLDISWVLSDCWVSDSKMTSFVWLIVGGIELGVGSRSM